MVLTSEAIEQNTYYEHGSLYYTEIKQYVYEPPDIIPLKMKEIGYVFTGRVMYIYDQFDTVYQKWFEVRRGRIKRYILA